MSFRFETTAIDLTDSQISLVREFTRSLAQESASHFPTEEMSSEIPAVTINTATAPLQLTLGWLKEQIAANGRVVSVTRIPLSTTVAGISGCTVTLRAERPISEAPEDFAMLQPIQEYVVSLGDLNPESTQVTEFWLYSRITFATHDNTPAVKVRSIQQGTGLVHNDGLERSLNLNVRDGPMLPQIVDALIHSIRLCQAK